MIKFLSKLLYVLRGKHKTLVLMVFLFLFISLLEVIGTGAIGPFISLATNPNSIEENYWLNWLYVNLNFTSRYQYLLSTGCFVAIIFVMVDKKSTGTVGIVLLCCCWSVSCDKKWNCFSGHLWRCWCTVWLPFSLHVMCNVQPLGVLGLSPPHDSQCTTARKCRHNCEGLILERKKEIRNIKSFLFYFTFLGCFFGFTFLQFPVQTF